jgi:HEAT repeat protein
MNMSQELLWGLVADVDRLLAAGAALAPEDAALRRREQPLRELAPRVPALAPVAQAVQRVLTATPAQAAPALLDLLLLTQQLRFSLAPAGIEGPLEPVPPSGPWATPLPTPEVRRLHEILTTSAEDRYHTLEQALAQGPIADLRLLETLLSLLEDPYAPLADLVAERALPAFGPAVLPELERRLNLQGKRPDARRLRSLCALAPHRGLELCRRALQEGSPLVRTQALEYLTEQAPQEAERLALEMLAQKKPPAELRPAIYRALHASRETAALDALLEGLQEKNWQAAEAAGKALAVLPHPETTRRLLDLLQATLAEEQALAQKKSAAPPRKGVAPAGKKPSPAAKAAARPEQLRRALQARAIGLLQLLGQRGDRQAVPALVPLLQHASADLREAAGEALVALADAQGLEAAAALASDRYCWKTGLRAIWRLPEPARYQQLAPLCAQLPQSRKTSREKADFVLELFEEEARALAEPLPPLRAPYQDCHWIPPRSGRSWPSARRTDWDPRWGPLLRNCLNSPHYAARAALALGVVEGEQAIPDLLQVLAPSIQRGECNVAAALGWLRARQAVSPLIALLPHQEAYHTCIFDALRRIGDPSAISLLEKIRGKLSASQQLLADQVLGALRRTAAQENTQPSR